MHRRHGKMESVIPRYFIVAERDHELQNPTSTEKLLDLGRRLRLDSSSRVLDIASGRGGPAILLAREFGCRIDGIEIAPEFHAVAIERARAAGVEEVVAFRLADASREDLPAEGYDVAMCLGASFVWGSLAGTLDALEPVVRPGGHVVVGEPFWRRLPVPEDYEERDGPYTTLEDTVTIMETGSLAVVSTTVASEDDWDRYETLHWRAVEEWLAENAHDPEAAEIRAQHERYKRAYLRHGRDYLGWAIFAGRKAGIRSRGFRPRDNP
jgi:SAM-dependent methyltransferase